MTQQLTHMIVGGGAAGFFGALSCAYHYPSHRVIIVEKSLQLLTKVRISGGGRCNVTHACFDPAILSKNYPRGSQELRGPFSRFQPSDTVKWFQNRGVTLKTEPDGRMFPISDSSETIVNCLLQSAKSAGIEILLQHGVENIEKRGTGDFQVTFVNGSSQICDRILLATGSTPHIHRLLAQHGHRIIPAVPSLFTFNIPDSPLLDLAGISVDTVKVSLPLCGYEQIGPLLLTHWGLSGPAVLKTSAWAARALNAVNYHTPVIIDWIPDCKEEAVRQVLIKRKQAEAARQIYTDVMFSLPKQLWKRLIMIAGIDTTARWSSLSHQQLLRLVAQLHATQLNIAGKTTYKQEFVTCGGVALEDVHFKTMGSRHLAGLFLAGEILNIDGITGGFNFQNAWTTGWIAGQSMGL